MTRLKEGVIEFPTLSCSTSLLEISSDLSAGSPTPCFPPRKQILGGGKHGVGDPPAKPLLNPIYNFLHDNQGGCVNPSFNRVINPARI